MCARSVGRWGHIDTLGVLGLAWLEKKNRILYIGGDIREMFIVKSVYLFYEYLSSGLQKRLHFFVRSIGECKLVEGSLVSWMSRR